MLITLIQKEMMHHILSVRFVALLVMCLLLVPLTLHINYRNYLQNQVNYKESLKLSTTEAEEKPPDAPDPDTEVSKLFLEPTPLSVFAKGLEESLPSYLGMTRNGVKQGSMSLGEAPLSSALGNLDFLFVVSTVFSLLALLFTFDAVAGEREAGHPPDYLVKRITARFVLVEQTHGWIYCVCCPVSGSVPVRFTFACLARFPLGRV